MAGYFGVILAALLAWAAGAAWYGLLARPWMAAAGIAVGPDGRPANARDPAPYVLSLITMPLTAGMLRHVLVTGGVETLTKGLLSGLGLGAFVAAPRIAMTHAYGWRPGGLMLIDGGYAVLACAIMGAVLTLG